MKNNLLLLGFNELSLPNLGSNKLKRSHKGQKICLPNLHHYCTAVSIQALDWTLQAFVLNFAILLILLRLRSVKVVVCGNAQGDGDLIKTGKIIQI